jgi:hypothetical protein
VLPADLTSGAYRVRDLAERTMLHVPSETRGNAAAYAPADNL